MHEVGVSSDVAIHGMVSNSLDESIIVFGYSIERRALIFAEMY
jgi:hypothetical protein